MTSPPPACRLLHAVFTGAASAVLASTWLAPVRSLLVGFIVVCALVALMPTASGDERWER